MKDIFSINQTFWLSYLPTSSGPQPFHLLLLGLWSQPLLRLNTICFPITLNNVPNITEKTLFDQYNLILNRCVHCTILPQFSKMGLYQNNSESNCKWCIGLVLPPTSSCSFDKTNMVQTRPNNGITISLPYLFAYYVHYGLY